MKRMSDSKKKEYKLLDELFPQINTKFGSVNKDNPEVVYLNTKVTVTPLAKSSNYVVSVRQTKVKIKEKIEQMLSVCDDIERKYILTVDMSEDSVSYGKKSRVKYDLFVKPKEIKGLGELLSLGKHISHRINVIISDILFEKGYKIA